MGDGTSQAFSDSRLGASQTILPSHNSHSHSPRPKPPKTCEPGKTHRLTFHKNKGKQKERREPSPKMLPGFKGRQTRIPPTALLGRKGHSLVAPELGVWCSPKKCSRRPGGAVPRWVEARSLPPALVAWGATVPTLASPGTPLAAALLVSGRGLG